MYVHVGSMVHMYMYFSCFVVLFLLACTCAHIISLFVVYGKHSYFVVSTLPDKASGIPYIHLVYSQHTCKEFIAAFELVQSPYMHICFCVEECECVCVRIPQPSLTD